MSRNLNINNAVEVFKDRDPRTKKHASKGNKERIILYTGDCSSRYCSFTSEKIGQHFIDGIPSKPSILPRALMVMYALQTGAPYPGTMGDYPFSEEEYPRKYQALVKELPDKALAHIERIKVRELFSSATHFPEDTAEQFCQRLLEDRAKLKNPEPSDTALILI